MKNLTLKALAGFWVGALLCVPLHAAQATADSQEKEAKAEKSDKEEWDVLNPPFELSSLDINTDEVTWSSLDISPDGKQMAFDMLGDIFIVDSEGGDAKALTQDFAWNIHPAFSPDGSKIAFISDRGGLSNVCLLYTSPSPRD